MKNVDNNLACPAIQQPTPTTFNNYYNCFEDDDGDATVVASNKSSKSPIRPTSIAMPTRWKAWQATIQEQDLATSNTIFNTSNIKIAVDMAIADAGATGHFVLPGAPMLNKRVAKNPIVINLPDGEQIRSTHTCELDLP